MFIDIHAHAYRRPTPFVTQFPTVEQIIERYDQHGIEKGILLPVVSPEIYLPQSNEDILEMCEQYPERLFAFCNLDPRALTNSADAPLDRVLGYYKDKGCRGVGEIMPNLSFMDPMVQNLFKHAQEVGLPVTFDGSDRISGDFGLYDEPGMPQLEHTLQRFPKLNILGHGMAFWAEVGLLETPARRKTAFRPDGQQVGFIPPSGPISEEGVVPKLLRCYPNLYGELSDAAISLGCDHEYGPRFLDEFQDKLFFGTDFCCIGQRFSTMEILLDWRDQDKISQTVFDKISRENAIKFFNL